MSLPSLISPAPDLTAAELERYHRQLALPQLGTEGQQRLRAARVCVVGAGGLGSPVLLYLAAVGVGTIGIVDDDVVTLANLQRQVLHDVTRLETSKVASAADRLTGLNPHTVVRQHPVRLDRANTSGILADYDVVVDATDNLPTRFLLTDVCTELGLPEVWGSVCRSQAQVSLFWSRPPAGQPPVTLRDLFPTEPEAPGCPDNSVIGVVCGMAGSLMAAEVVKVIIGAGETLLGRLLLLDAFSGRTAEVPLRSRRTP